jgi:hypothetical protein
VNDVWRVPAYLPYLQPRLTSARLAAAEKQLGVKLPRSYVALLEVQNGGYVRRKLPDHVFSKIWGIGPHFPSITREREWHDEWSPKDAQGLVPFDGDGHWHLCFDYRKRGRTREPSITYVDNELEREQKIAESFDSFLALLEPDIDEYTFGLAHTSLKAVVKAIQPLLKARFERPSSFDHGYPIQRARFGTSRDPQWIWLSPNEAPRGFARKGEPRYAELVKLLPGTALRYPDCPEAEVIVQATDGAFERVRAACKQAGLETVTLVA